jgi:hypothetical protein
MHFSCRHFLCFLFGSCLWFLFGPRKRCLLPLCDHPFFRLQEQCKIFLAQLLDLLVSVQVHVDDVVNLMKPQLCLQQHLQVFFHSVCPIIAVIVGLRLGFEAAPCRAAVQGFFDRDLQAMVLEPLEYSPRSPCRGSSGSSHAKWRLFLLVVLAVRFVVSRFMSRSQPEVIPAATPAPRRNPPSGSAPRPSPLPASACTPAAARHTLARRNATSTWR